MNSFFKNLLVVGLATAAYHYRDIITPRLQQLYQALPPMNVVMNRGNEVLSRASSFLSNSAVELSRKMTNLNDKQQQVLATALVGAAVVTFSAFSLAMIYKCCCKSRRLSPAEVRNRRVERFQPVAERDVVEQLVEDSEERLAIAFSLEEMERSKLEAMELDHATALSLAETPGFVAPQPAPSAQYMVPQPVPQYQPYGTQYQPYVAPQPAQQQYALYVAPQPASQPAQQLAPSAPPLEKVLTVAEQIEFDRAMAARMVNVR